MNRSRRFVSSLWESFLVLFDPFVFTLSSRLRLNFSPLTKLVDPLYHKYLVTSFFRGSQWISVVQFLVSSLTVLFTINHMCSSSSVGGSTFFNPYFMYEFTLFESFPMLYEFSCSDRLSPVHCSFSFLHLPRIPPPNFARHYFRVLCWFLLTGTKMFQFPVFLHFICVLSH